MKKIKFVIPILFLLLTVLPGFAEDEEIDDSGIYFGIGGNLEWKGTVNLGKNIDGRENMMRVIPVPDFYLGFTFLNFYELGGIVNLGLNSQAYGYNNYFNEDVTAVEYYRYFNFGVDFFYRMLIVGINFGIPVGGSWELEQTFGNQDGEISTDVLSTLMEVKLGLMIPLFQNEAGRLNLNIIGSYAFSGIFQSYATDWPNTIGSTKPITDDQNPYPISLSMGLSYYLNITKF